jgi:hypothetical protein
MYPGQQSSLLVIGVHSLFGSIQPRFCRLKGLATDGTRNMVMDTTSRYAVDLLLKSLMMASTTVVVLAVSVLSPE